jgi:hypothetical protein
MMTEGSPIKQQGYIKQTKTKQNNQKKSHGRNQMDKDKKQTVDETENCKSKTNKSY